MKIINVDIERKEVFFEKYDKSIVSKELLNYIIDKGLKNELSDMKIIVYSKLDLDFKTLIIEGLEKELESSCNNKRQTNLTQFMLVLLGVFFIFLSVLLKDSIIWHEVILIIGWVPIWEAIDIELFRDSKERKRRAVIRKLLNSDIEVK